MCNSSRSSCGAGRSHPHSLKKISEPRMLSEISFKAKCQAWDGKVKQLGCACTWWSWQLLRDSWVRRWGTTNLQSGMSFQPSKVWYMCRLTPSGVVLEESVLTKTPSGWMIFKVSLKEQVISECFLRWGVYPSQCLQKAFALFFWYYRALDGNRTIILGKDHV